MTRVIIIGAGFGGLTALKELRKSRLDLEILLFDKDEYFEFTPSLPVTLGNPGYFDKIRIPLKRFPEYIQEEVIQINSKSIKTKKATYGFDYLIVATGSLTNYYGNKTFEKFAFPIKRIEHVKRINKELEKVKSVTVVGGGYTGVEIVGMLLKDKKVNLVHGMERLLPGVNEGASRKAEKYFRKKGVEIYLNDLVVECSPGKVKLKSGKVIESDLILISTGIIPNDSILKQKDIGKNLALKSNPKIYLIGDVGRSGTLPTAHNAMIEGKYAVFDIRNKLGEKKRSPRDMDWRFLGIYLGRNHGLLTWKNFAIELPFVGLGKKIIEMSVLSSLSRI